MYSKGGLAPRLDSFTWGAAWGRSSSAMASAWEVATTSFRNEAKKTFATLVWSPRGWALGADALLHMQRFPLRKGGARLSLPVSS